MTALARLFATIRDSLADLSPTEIVLHMHPDTLAELRTDADGGAPHLYGADPATALDFRVVPDASVARGRWECYAS